MKAYLDNSVVSAIAKDDMPAESGALMELLEASDAGKLELVTSEVTRKEIEQLEGQHRRNVEVVYRLLKKVRFIEAQELLGFHSQWGPHGGFAWPLIEDEPVWAKLLQMGLDRTDAHHLMLAIHAGCHVFLTCDEDFLSRRAEMEREFGIRVMRPSELVREFPPPSPAT